jgi:hypothetical protein
MNNASSYLRWVKRKWRTIAAVVITMGGAAILIGIRAGLNLVFEALLLAVATSLLVELVFELSGKEEFVNLVHESLGVQQNLRDLGIEKAYQTGQEAFADMQTMLGSAEQLDFLALSGRNSYPNLEQDFKQALRRGCQIRVLLCDEKSDFVRDRECQEAVERHGDISREIESSLKSVFHKASVDLHEQNIEGRLEVRTHTYAIYSNLVIARKQNGEVERVLFVPYLNSIAARFAMAFSYTSTEHSQCSIMKLVQCFDTLWGKSRLRLKHDFASGDHECDLEIESCRIRR